MGRILPSVTLATASLIVGLACAASLTNFVGPANATTCNSDPNNLVANCGFETHSGGYWGGAPPWIFSNARPHFISHTGTWAVAMPYYGGNGTSSIAQTIDLSAGIYNLSIWIAASFTSTESGTLTATLGSATAFNLAIVDGLGWTQFNGQVILNSGGLTSLTFAAITQNCTYACAFFIDDVSLSVAPSQTPLPAALPLFVTGLGVMGWLARRKKRKTDANLVAA